MMWSELEYVLVGRQVDKMAVGKAPSDDGKYLSKEERNSDALGHNKIVFLCTKESIVFRWEEKKVVLVLQTTAYKSFNSNGKIY